MNRTTLIVEDSKVMREAEELLQDLERVSSTGPSGRPISSRGTAGCWGSRFLGAEGIPTLTGDMGGYQARHVRFQMDTGWAFVKRVGGAPLKARLAEVEA